MIKVDAVWTEPFISPDSYGAYWRPILVIGNVSLDVRGGQYRTRKAAIERGQEALAQIKDTIADYCCDGNCPCVFCGGK